MNIVERNVKIDELESLAGQVLSVKHESIPRRPIVVEFCGSPKSGKSTCINSLNLFLRRNNFRTRVLTERASVCPITDKYDPNFNIWTACSAIAELSEILANNSKDYDVVILDRGIFDALCWFNWLKENGCLDDSDFHGLESFLFMNKWQRAVDLIYVFTADPDESMKREYANLMTTKPGRIMNFDTLQSYKACIEKTSLKYTEKYQRIENINTTGREIDFVNYEVTKNTLNILRENLMERIGYIPRASISNNLPESFYLDEAKIGECSLLYDYRGNVEKSDEFVQPIPVLVITNKKKDKVYVVKKNKKSSAANSPEANKLLVYLGGHSRKEDGFGKTDNSLFAVTRETLKREIKEETGLNYVPPSDENNPLCIWVRDNERSKKHIALVHLFEVDETATKISLDKNEFIDATNTISGKFMSLVEIAERSDELESWSKIILNRCFHLNLFKTGELL